MPSKKHVMIFPAGDGSACTAPSCTLGCDHCRKGPVPSSPRLTITEVRRILNEDFADKVDVWVADYETEDRRREAVERANRLFDAGNISMRLELPGLDDFVAQAAPVIAIDDRVLSIIVVPTREQLVAALSGPAAKQEPGRTAGPRQ
jgi:hypothetical protein